MICNKCGAEVAEGDKFCMACGSEVTASSEPTRDAQPCEEPIREAQPCEERAQYFSDGEPEAQSQSPKSNKKKTLLCVISVVLALMFVLGGASSAIGVFSGDGPLGDVADAFESNLEDGFAFSSTLSYAGNSFAVKGVMLGTEDNENAIPAICVTYEDSVYYIDDDCIYVLNETMNMVNLNYKEEGEDRSRFSLMKEIFAADLEDYNKYGKLCELAEYLNCFAGERIYDEEGFEKCAEAILDKLSDADYLEENFDYEEKSRKNRTEITFEFEMDDLMKLALNEFKDCRDAYVWEQDYERALGELKELKEDFGDETEAELEFIIEDDHLISASVKISEGSGEDTDVTSVFIEFSDFGEAGVDSDIAEKVSDAKAKLGDLPSIIRDEEDGYYYYDDEGEKVYVD